jgi:glyoxylase-like metal-dependent hydrolase (beta-lactamase superfamily II)
MSWVHEDDVMAITKLSVGPWDNNAYVLVCAQSGEAAIIDAANEAERILEASSPFDVKRVLTTHGHSDHIMALEAVVDALGVPWHLHADDIEIAGMKPDELLIHGQEIAIGQLNVHVIHTPGHTPGSVSFVVEPVLFTGDTLFPGGPGATRWDYSSFGQIMDSIETELMRHPDPTVVHPGHGASTSIGAERPQVETWRARGW